MKGVLVGEFLPIMLCFYGNILLKNLYISAVNMYQCVLSADIWYQKPPYCRSYLQGLIEGNIVSIFVLNSTSVLKKERKNNWRREHIWILVFIHAYT